MQKGVDTMLRCAKLYLTKRKRLAKMLVNLGVIAAYTLLNVVAAIIIGAILVYIDEDKTPDQFKLPTLQRVSIQRKANGDMYEYFINRETNEKYLKIGKQWRNAKTGRIVSAKSIGV